MRSSTAVTDAPAPRGLSTQEAADRLRSDGPNLLPDDTRRTLWRALLGIAREPMVLLLVSATGIYLVLGDTTEALTLLASVGLVVAITLVQEGRTERALRTLRALSSPRAQVFREGRVVTVPIVVTAAFAGVTAVLAVPPLRALFRFAECGIGEVVAAAAASIGAVLAADSGKALRRRVGGL